jgi:MarR family multiple antibiotic resistance transcriptional regulator
MPSPDRQQLSRLIAQILPNIIQGVHMGFLATQSLTHTQFFVLIAIHSQGRCTMQQLADKMHVSMPTMSGIIDRLVQAKYVARVENPDDRRQVVIELRKEGKNLIVQFQQAVSSRWHDVLGALNAQEVKTMAAILGKIGAFLLKEGGPFDA